MNYPWASYSKTLLTLRCVVLLGACSSRTDAGAPDGSVDSGAGDLGAADFGHADLGPRDAGTVPDAAFDARADASSLVDAALPDVDASVLYTEPDYDACGGNTFFPDGSCADGACAASDFEARVYGVWKTRFLETHHLDATQFAERIDVSSLSYEEGPVYNWWRVDYVLHLDWVRSRQSESVNLGEYPASGDPSDEEIAHAVDLAIESAERFDVPAVAQFEHVVDAIVACSPYVTLDWCSLDFENVSGNPIVHTRSRSPDAVCKAIQVQLADASTDMCLIDRCSIH